MDYGGFEGDMESYGRAHGYKNPSMLGCLLLTGLTATASVFLGTFEWRYHDLLGECQLIESGAHRKNWPCCQDATDFSSMVQTYCAMACTGNTSAVYEQNQYNCDGFDRDRDPFYGQCIAPPLSIAYGTVGMFAALLAASSFTTCQTPM